ncbi:cytochrome P450 [Gaeumannomyces tritici R3-111a-1]|uniref:Cytochrome P450 n=1 Tax=Gaeumannomyces tritici (strain R3-111a-1) TaxID=644352 RepID=J3PJV4_GAET3|nr:cytochrome P450 [Gaeumannomyces tritici R3-111a-1]EJT68638.1 cytochrome P450 [Gaeumannomyces tritici R3-111a-1]
MRDSMILLLYLAVPSLLFSVLKQILSWNKKKGKEGEAKFPGPKQFPIVGRIHDLPRFQLWLKFKEWADIHGPIYQTRAVDTTFVVVSDEKIAEELLVKRGHIYSGRPQIRSLIGHKEGIGYVALMDRHDHWQRQRKWVHAAMAEAYRNHFYGHVEAETTKYLAMLLADPSRFYCYTREHCGRIMSRLAWDQAQQGAKNGMSADTTLHCMSVSGPITNTVAPLWFLPWKVNPWKQYEVKREAEQRAWWLDNYDISKRRFLAGELPKDTWAYRYMEQVRAGGNETLTQDRDEELFASCMIGFFNLVGVVTISGPTKFFLMAMALFPEWQKKAQEEIDRVCGDEMPTLANFADLPTVRAILKETVRWRSGVPLGVPHQAEKDDVYRGVTIKKGTIVLACEWSINRVPERYPDPENFRPERYLEAGWPTFQEPLTKYPNFRDGVGMHSFGWGRRTCLGQNIVDDEMFVTAAAVLWGFNMAQKVDQRTGEIIPIDTQATNSHVILEPDPWQMTFAPRSEARAAKIMHNYEQVRPTLKVED